MTNSKVALITGGSSGIGLAIAKRFIDEGVRVIITGRNKVKLVDAKNKLGDNCFAVQMDMAQINSIADRVKEIIDQFGRIDILVNNAGVNQKKKFSEVSNEEYEAIVTINQTAIFCLSREVVNAEFIPKGQGVIIHISSMAAHYGIPGVISYTASKSAVEGMTRSMAVDLSPLGIRVNCVAPGFISTPMTEIAFDQDAERQERVLKRTPMGAMGSPEDIANAVYFLASDEAAFITGEVLKVDGGNSIGF